MPATTDQPALPWAATASSDAQTASGLSFEESIRKVVLAAAVDLHDRGDVGPVKRARTMPNDAENSRQQGADLASTLVNPLVDQMGRAERVDLSKNQRIEVKWQLNKETSQECKWWGATLLREITPSDTAETATEDRSAARAVTWVIRYDAYDDFEEEEREATFITQHVLAHTDNLDEIMAWRNEGNDYEPSDSIDSDEDDPEGSRVVTTGADGSKTTVAELRQYGGSVESAAMERMASVPVAAQQHIAAKLSEYSSKLAVTLKKLIEDKGTGGIDGNDMREALARMQ